MLTCVCRSDHSPSIPWITRVEVVVAVIDSIPLGSGAEGFGCFVGAAVPAGGKNGAGASSRILPPCSWDVGLTFVEGRLVDGQRCTFLAMGA